MVDTRSAVGARDGLVFPRRVWTGVRTTVERRCSPSMDLNPELISAGQDSNSDPLETTAEGAEGDDKKKMGIDHEPTFRYWVRKGRRTVDEFGVEVAHG